MTTVETELSDELQGARCPSLLLGAGGVPNLAVKGPWSEIPPEPFHVSVSTFSAIKKRKA